MAYVHKEFILDVNTYLTNFATNYVVPSPTAEFIAPSFRVKLEDGKYVEYTKSVLRIFDDKIKGDVEPREIQWNVSESTYSCEEYAMGKFISDKKKAQSVKPINLDKDAVKMVKQFHELARAYRIEQIAGNTALITNNSSPVNKWSTAAGVPVTDILTAMSSVYTNTTGYNANKILIPTDVALKMIQTTEWKEYFKYTDTGFNNGLWSAISGLKQLGLMPQLEATFGLSEAKCTSSDPTSAPLWDEKVLVFYSEPTPTLESRTFMFSPFVAKDIITTTRKPRRRGVYHDIYSDIDELLVDANAGYLLTNVL